MHQPLQALAPLIRRPFLPLTIGAWLLTLTACTTIEVNLPPGQVHAPDRFTQVKPAPPTDDEPTDLSRWWQGIPDPTLHALIEKGLTANADVRIAAARVREARAVVTQAESALYPTLAALGYAGRTQQNEAGVQTPSQVQAPTSVPGLPLPLPNLPPISLPSINAPKLPISAYSGHGFAATWEVDIFGSRRSDAEAARSAALANEERLHGAQLMVAGDIAANYVEARSLERRIGVLQRTISQAERLQRYAQGRFDAGQATRYDVDRVSAQVQALRGGAAPLQTLLQSRLRRMAVLTGQAPEQLPQLPAPTAQAPADGSAIPSKLPAVLPSDVLERRPDVRGTAQLVRARAAQLGSAKADLLPRFYLGFLANDGRIEIGDLGATGRFTSWGAGLYLPIFEAGRIRARIRASDAQLEAAIAQHEQTVLTALEDVENAYGTRRALDQRSTQLQSAWLTADQGARHAQRLFDEGSGLLQGAIEARLSALQREDELIQAETARALVTVALYKAVGGGWSDQPAQDAKP
ncbi:TolC family protein [Aquabacterium sp. UBA2148]|uniref:TolC family protein n=1 Tax=Aquabacterium sp. UBA2148 TaxID=1946042 RepID=UPI002580742A|nr:TolC family protein [Aquabacterium sp. UBA2148]